MSGVRDGAWTRPPLRRCPRKKLATIRHGPKVGMDCRRPCCRAVTDVVKHKGGAESGPYCLDCALWMSELIPESKVEALPYGDPRRYTAAKLDAGRGSPKEGE